MLGKLPHRGLWLAVAICVTIGYKAAGQAVRTNDLVAELARAQQLFDDGNSRQAAAILQRMIGAARDQAAAVPETVAAARLLAQVYHRSADYPAAVRTVGRFAQFSPQPDAEMLLILADSQLALGRTDDARRQLDRASSLLQNKSAGSARDARLAVEAERIADAFRRRTSGGSLKAAREHRTTGSPQRLEILSADFQQEQRFEVVTLAANHYLDTGRIDDAIALLTKEISSPSYDAFELADLKLQLADCFHRRGATFEESGDSAARQTAMAAESRTLVSLGMDLKRQQEQRLEVEDAVKLLSRKGTLHERQAALALAASNPAGSSASLVTQHLQEAAKCYTQIIKRADDLERTGKAAQTANSAGENGIFGRADQYRDLAMCGLQRVFESLRLAKSGQNNEELNAELCRVSDQLIAERAQRMLATDPALYDAKRAAATVYASIDTRASHERAATLYLELVAYWEANPYPQLESQATALIGLAEMLRALDQTKEAFRFALQANRLIASIPVGDDATSQRDRALLAARIENSLGIVSIALGEYRDALNYLTLADQRLAPFGNRAGQLRRQNEEALLVLSRMKVYRALLHKAEAQYDDAVSRVSEGRQLREKLQLANIPGVDQRDLLAYYLAEASVRLAQARELKESARKQSVLGVQDSSFADTIAKAETALKKAQPFTGLADPEPGSSQTSAVLPYLYLRGVLSRMRGDWKAASQELATLADECQRQGDGKIEAKCYMQLAQLTIDGLAEAPSKSNEATTAKLGATASRAQATELRDLKLKRRAAIENAAGYADRAVALFKRLDAAEDELTVTALPSLHFQASFLAARLQIVLATLDSHITRLDEMLTADAPPPGVQRKSSNPAGASPADRRQRAIYLLKDAVEQAERPASSTTQVRLQRAQYFSRYAPAYDLLVDLYVAMAVGQADSGHFNASTHGYAELRRAMEIADLARNRTFREQIDGWQRTAGNEPKPIVFEWNKHLPAIADSGTALLMYHLDGPQLLPAAAGTATLGGGHLFVALRQGEELLYYRLKFAQPESGSRIDLSRRAAAELVRRQIEWIVSPDSAQDWGDSAQRALTECLLPSGLVKQLRERQHLLIVTDGALNQMPFESLLLPEAVNAQDRAKHYVIDDLPAIRYGPSLSVLAAITERGTTRDNHEERLLTVGNPSYPQSARQHELPAWQELLRQFPDAQGGFVPLTHSEEECGSVYASFAELPAASRTKLVQAGATEAAVRQHIANSRFVHIAAHGCVDYQNDNLFGALILTPGSDTNDPQNDGLLQLREIYALDLSHCDLAVLSACQTYVGAERPLEAGTSMARAFLEQGAKRVVCSQWSTDDRATTDLMKSFFNALRTARRTGKEIDYDAALHDAKLTIRRDLERGSLPKYWAAFVLVGAR